MTSIFNLIQIARENSALIYVILIGIGLLWAWDRRGKECKRLREENEDLRYIQQSRREEQNEN